MPFLECLLVKYSVKHTRDIRGGGSASAGPAPVTTGPQHQVDGPTDSTRPAPARGQGFFGVRGGKELEEWAEGGEDWVQERGGDC